MLLTYPFGEALGTAPAVSAADAVLFIPLTCRENAGMTAPIHAIVWRQLGDTAAAEAALNRSMHAAAYGPFNVRNEVDKHPDVIGADFDNTKFLTGDGGFLQALMFGYGGLRIVDDGLLLRRPAPPTGDVGHMVLRGLAWRGRVFTLNVTHDEAVLMIAGASASGVGLVDALGACVSVPPGGGVALGASVAWPALIAEACGASSSTGGHGNERQPPETAAAAAQLYTLS